MELTDARETLALQSGQSQRTTGTSWRSARDSFVGRTARDPRRAPKKNLTQGELASKVNTTAATISNIETGCKHGDSKIAGQVRTVLLVKIRRALSIKVDEGSESLEEKFKQLVTEFADLDEREIDLVLGLIAGLKTQRASKSR